MSERYKRGTLLKSQSVLNESGDEQSISNYINEIQNLINYESATTSSNIKCNFQYITSSQEILNGKYSLVIEDSSRGSHF